MFTETIKTWRKKFNQLFFTYSKGFYHLPYNGSTPQDLINSIGNLPFVNHDKEKQCVNSKNPFCEGGFYYYELEKGCWIIYSKMRYKANVSFDLFSEEEGFAPATSDDFYMLSLNNIGNPVHVKKSICPKQQCFPSYSLTFFKPNERNCDLNFKGSNNRFITLYISENWLRNNLMDNSKLFAEAQLNTFIASDLPSIIWPLSEDNKVLENFSLFDKVMNIDGNSKEVDVLKLKHTALGLVFDLLELCKTENVFENYSLITKDENDSVKKVENYLSNHLLDKFQGIEYLSKKFNISETKLKAEFKQLFGEPIYHYFKRKQMRLAKEILSENQLIVKEIAYKLGYESNSKFSAAFKKYHGVLPSEVRNLS